MSLHDILVLLGSPYGTAGALAVAFAAFIGGLRARLWHMHSEVEIMQRALDEMRHDRDEWRKTAEQEVRDARLKEEERRQQLEIDLAEERARRRGGR